MATYHLVGRREVRQLENFILPAYRSWLQSPNMLVYCAKEHDLVVGVIGVWLSEDVANIVSLSVSPAYQRQGIGLGLVSCVQARFADYECKRIQVTLALELEHYVSLIGLFFDADFEEEVMPVLCRTCSVSEILRHPLVRKTLQALPKGVVSVKSVPNVSLRTYNATYQLDIDWRLVDPELSVVYLNQGQIVGTLLVRRETEDSVCLSWLHMAPGHAGAIISLMALAGKNVALNMGLNTTFTATLLTKTVTQIWDKLLPQEGTPADLEFTRLSWKG